MAESLEGKVALVTGGSSGIGRATSLAFAREGARVVILDVNAEGGEGTAAKIKEQGGDALVVKGDVSKAEDNQNAVEQAVAAYGRLTLWLEQ